MSDRFGTRLFSLVVVLLFFTGVFQPALAFTDTFFSIQVNGTPDRSSGEQTFTLPVTQLVNLTPSQSRQIGNKAILKIQMEHVSKDTYMKGVWANRNQTTLLQRAQERGFGKLNESRTVKIGETATVEVGTFVSDQGDEIRLVHLVTGTLDTAYLVSTVDGIREVEFADGSTVARDSNDIDAEWLKCYLQCIFPDTPEETIIEFVKIVLEYGIYLLCNAIGCGGCVVTAPTGIGTVTISPLACTACALCIAQTITSLTLDINEAGTCAAGCGEHVCYYVEDQNCRGKPLDAYEQNGVCYYGTYHAGNPESDDPRNCCTMPDNIPMDYCEKYNSFFLGKYMRYETTCGPVNNPNGYQCFPTTLTIAEACSDSGYGNGQQGRPDPVTMCGAGEIVKAQQSFPGDLWCWNCGRTDESTCSGDAECFSDNCVPSCTGGSDYCCPATSFAWSSTDGCIGRCECSLGNTCPECQRCDGGSCVDDDSNADNSCPGTCCGGICAEEDGICCNRVFYSGTDACCSGVDCNADEECSDHQCLKRNYQTCSSSDDCASGNCDGCLDEKRCCPDGMKWDGSTCIYHCGAPIHCPNTCHPGSPATRFLNGQPYVPSGYDNNNDGIPEGACPIGHNDVLDVTGDDVYDCCYQRETCPSATFCSGGICSIGNPMSCSGAGYSCCDACSSGTEHPEFSDCTSSGGVCCGQCQFGGCNPACPDPVSCDLITSSSYAGCCNPGDPSCPYTVQQYTADGWQTCGYQNTESCCAAWKEANYCYAWIDDQCGGGDCTPGMMHQIRNCWGTNDCPESRCVARSSCEKSVIGYSDAKISTYSFPNCVDPGTVNASCSYTSTLLMEPDGEIGDGTAQGNMILGMDGSTLYNENTQNSAFNYWEPMSRGSISNFIEMKHEVTYPAGCLSGYVYYGGSCYRYRCNSANEDCGVTIKSPAVPMSKPGVKLPLTREQYYSSDVSPHVVWYAATSGSDKLTADQMRNYVKTTILDPCMVTINGEKYYHDNCITARSYGIDEDTAGFSVDIEPFFFYEEISELTSPDLVVKSVATAAPIIETQDAVIRVNITNRPDRFGYGVDVKNSFYVDAYVNETFLERKRISGLDAGNTSSLYYLVQNMTASSSLIKVNVDPTNAISEREEQNNWLITTIALQPKTDLLISDVRLITTGKLSGDAIPVNVTVQNLGTSTAGNFVIGLSCDNQLRDITFTSLGAHQSRYISLNWTAVYGMHTINVTADAVPADGGVIPETNEANNHYSIPVTISLKGNSPPDLHQPLDFPSVKVLDPYSGNTTTLFIYRITYLDPDNDAPAADSPKVWIDVNGDSDYTDVFGSFTEGGYTMTGTVAGDSIYSDGKGYQFTTYLPESLNYTFRFTANDARGIGANGMTNTIYGPIVLRAPAPPVISVPGYSNPPTDPDNDGIYEDLNANGRLDFADVVLYFNQMSWIAANEPIAAFDLNGNGRIDFADIVALFNEI